MLPYYYYFFFLYLQLASALEEQRSQSALQLRENLEVLRREAEQQLKTEGERNQMLLSQSQQEISQLHLKVKILFTFKILDD